ncbi:MAG TPA: hypothetical protein VND19_04720 [Acetobacteraceae bacterium]|nr:hypothetical protein [Acetobacteraceae bacterium]
MNSTPAQHLQPDPATQLQLDIHDRAVDTLRGILPPPLDDTPEAWSLRDRVALATVASLLAATPVEACLAVLRVAAAEYACHFLRRLPHYADDPRREAQVLAQSASMGREARGHLNPLLRLQAVRIKREANVATRDSTAMSEYCTLGLMTGALQRQPPGPPARPAMPPAKAAPAAAPAPRPEMVRLRDYSEWSDEEKRLERLESDAGRYAVLHPERVKLIHKLGALPENCDFEPPDPELLHETITGNNSNLRWAGGYQRYKPT